MRTITLEEHFTTPGFRSGAGKKREEHAAKTGGRLAEVFAKLADVGDKRIAEMDAAGIDMQVLSLTAPGTEQSEAAAAVGEAQEANDFLAAAVKKYPKRFAGFAILPTAAPEKAAEELERRVRNDGFVGANIHGHNRGRYLDDKFYWPILERAEALGVPLYLHPTHAAAGGDRRLVRRLLAAGHRSVRRSGLGLAHRDRDPHPAHDPWRRVRPLSEAAIRHRPSRRSRCRR